MSVRLLSVLVCTLLFAAALVHKTTPFQSAEGVESSEWGSRIGGDGPPQAKAMVAHLINTTLPCLAPYTIHVEDTESNEYYLRSAPDPLTVLRPPLKRTYIMYANPQLFDPSFGPDEAALDAIITHELNHILDYTHMNTLQLGEFGAMYALNYTFQVAYEHETDHRVLQLQKGTALAGYRAWIYSVLDAKERATKKVEYYTPAEIALWQRVNVGVYVNPCEHYFYNYTCIPCLYRI
eukprot:TRINITY_DN4977_c0_g1_i1.p1 TRINITY_DN4977_c0_g1~~TRINITY_DN4977_c0_g1_i1.p1  ORF type:complete len:236 (+),score=42.36 TRINITY_DN4977_c0_g1_i1:80-787(+)